MKPFIDTLKALSIGIAIFLPGVTIAEVIIENNAITGIVSYVDRTGIIYLEDGASLSPNFPVKQSYAIRHWALQIEPKALAVIVDGRRITCHFIYELDDIIVGSCGLFFNNYAADNGFIFSSRVLDIARTLNLGQVICSSEDQDALAADPSLNTREITPSDCMKGSQNKL